MTVSGLVRSLYLRAAGPFAIALLHREWGSSDHKTRRSPEFVEDEVLIALGLQADLNVATLRTPD
jgi:hypothetical protein